VFRRNQCVILSQQALQCDSFLVTFYKCSNAYYAQVVKLQLNPLPHASRPRLPLLIEATIINPGPESVMQSQYDCSWSAQLNLREMASTRRFWWEVVVNTAVKFPTMRHAPSDGRKSLNGSNAPIADKVCHKFEIFLDLSKILLRQITFRVPPNNSCSELKFKFRPVPAAEGGDKVHRQDDITRSLLHRQQNGERLETIPYRKKRLVL